jgi:radical SAM superfamily enzyme YgiQ (UPF0313 family)
MNYSIFLINPPFMQVNSPYPSCLYLKEFIKKEFSLNNKLPFSLYFYDLNIMLFNKIFSKNGLKIIFSLTKERFDLKRDFTEDEKKELFLFYYLNRDFYIENIDFIISFLKGEKENFSYNLSKAFQIVKIAPYGERIRSFLELNSISCDYNTVFTIFSLIIDEISDFINLFFDSNFNLSNYGFHLKQEYSFFEKIKKEIREANILNIFLKEILQNEFNFEKLSKYKKVLFLITCPFPSNIIPSFYIANFVKKMSNLNTLVALGGGYVSSELRFIKNKEIFNFIDYIIYDKGFSSLKEIINSILDKDETLSYDKLYKTVLFDGNKINFINFEKEDIIKYQFINILSKHFETIRNDSDIIKIDNFNNFDFQTNKETEFINTTSLDEISKYENNTIFGITPDYSEIDFNHYVRLKETSNPMLSLWSSSKWLKAYLAWGCYWSKCKFCDINLDYIKSYSPVKPEILFENLLKYKDKGISGIHFVDESMPLNNLIKFASLNAKNNFPFNFWGNFRIEKNLTYDIINFLSKTGLIAVTVGVESLIDNTLKKINKGIDVENIIKTCYLLKSNGVLVHLYLIYGFFFESEADIINSIEIIRQMFIEGIIDSVFFHRFTLTFHSGFISDQLDNFIKNSSLKDNSFLMSSNSFNSDFDFAFNDLYFKNSQFYDKFDDPIQKIAFNFNNYIGLENPIKSWFDFNIVDTDIDENYVSNIINNITYEIELNKIILDKKLCFVGSEVDVLNIDNYNGELIWFYEGEKKRIKFSNSFCNFFKEILNKNRIENIENNIKISEFINLFEEKLKIPFSSFSNTKNFLKLKKNGLLFI